MEHLESDDAKINKINKQIDVYKVSIADTERNCINLLDESIKIGVNTLAELDSQTEKLDTISNKLRDVETNTYASDKTVTAMQWRKQHPFLSFFFGKRVKKPKWFSASSEPEPTNTPTNTPTNDITLSVRGKHNTAPSDKVITDDKFIDTIQNKVDILKNMAIDMGTELDNHNHKITNIIAHTEHNTEHIGKTRTKVMSMLT